MSKQLFGVSGAVGWSVRIGSQGSWVRIWLGPGEILGFHNFFKAKNGIFFRNKKCRFS